MMKDCASGVAAKKLLWTGKKRLQQKNRNTRKPYTKALQTLARWVCGWASPSLAADWKRRKPTYYSIQSENVD